ANDAPPENNVEKILFILLKIAIFERTENSSVELNTFMKPKTQDISYFFKFHPYQPKDPFSLFSSNKIFFRENGTNRIWLTFDESSKKLFC
ncbi:Zinc finger MYM-type protein 1, partial [Aphis craccivora]